MSVWATKSLGKDRNYIVLQHPLRGVNYVVMGIKFRDSYAVIQKDSKTYFTLKKMPIFKNSKEYPLEYLQKLSFITRAKDVEMVYGREVYRFYVSQVASKEAQEKIKNEKEEYSIHLATGGCTYTANSKGKCSHVAVENSPSSYCLHHILEDKGLAALGITFPRIMTKEEKLKQRHVVANKLSRMSKVGKSNGEIIGDTKEAE